MHTEQNKSKLENLCNCQWLVVFWFRDKSAAEKRRQVIQESKFLGGDMEHTHLVKGLDFALLQKVRQHGTILTITL